MFTNRKLLIATKHHKQKVIAPLFEAKLGVSCFVSERFDTDSLGTFSGEIERKDDALTTLRKKCHLAMQLNNTDLVIGSEGSFGAHPSVYFAAADDELMMFIDAKNNLEIIAREISMETNFNASIINSFSELIEFAKRTYFPSHALIMRRSKDDCNHIIKGISDLNTLKKNYVDFKNKFDSVYVETDMRAHLNPTRMNVIKKTAEKLLNNIFSVCPICQTPGFTIIKAIPGLPCDWCNSPTSSTLSFLYSCKKCGHQNEVFYPHQKTKEDPTYCNFCNP